MKLHADRFRAVAIHLVENLEGNDFVTSVLLEGSLSVELYLKSFHAQTQYSKLLTGGVQITSSPALWDHHLVRLFDNLDPILREELQLAYQNYLRTNFPLDDFPQGTLSDDGQPLLSGSLAKYQSVFVDYRYLFEKKSMPSITLNGLITLCDFFHDFIESMQGHTNKSEHATSLA